MKGFNPNSHSTVYPDSPRCVRRAACVLSWPSECAMLQGGQVKKLVGTTKKGKGPDDKTWGSSFAKGVSLANLLEQAISQKSQQELRGTFWSGSRSRSCCSTWPTVRFPHTFFLMYSFSTRFLGPYCILGTLLRDIMVRKALKLARSLVQWERWTPRQARTMCALMEGRCKEGGQARLSGWAS